MQLRQPKNVVEVTRFCSVPNVSVYCTASERTLLKWLITSPDTPGIMFVEFFDKKYLSAMDEYIMVIPACPYSALYAVKAPDEKLQINELGPYVMKRMEPI